MLISAPLWKNTRFFPLLPVSERFPILSPPLDQWLFIGLLLIMALSLRFYRVCISVFLLGILFLSLEDLNRCQPWVYIYWVMMLLTMLPEQVAIPGCRLALSAVYFWAGVQKFNSLFFHEVAPFFAAPLAQWLPVWAVNGAQWSIAAAPVIEIFIAGGLWIPTCRRVAILAACLLHATGLLLLGPLGNQFNAVVWPWNVAMVLLILILFQGADDSPAGISSLVRDPRATVLLALFCLLPVLSYWGKWDSYLSFRLYSGNTARGSIFVSERVPQQLPSKLNEYMSPADFPEDHPLHGSLMFDFRNWGEVELGVPPIPEPRSYRAIANYLAALGANPGEVLLIIQRSGGSVEYYHPPDVKMSKK